MMIHNENLNIWFGSSALLLCGNELSVIHIKILKKKITKLKYNTQRIGESEMRSIVHLKASFFPLCGPFMLENKNKKHNKLQNMR